MAANDTWLQSTASPSGKDVWLYALQSNPTVTLNIYLYPIASGSDVYVSDPAVLAAVGVFASTGVASTSLIGAVLDIGVFASTGVASTSLIGAVLDIGVFASTGVASTSLIGVAAGIGVLTALPGVDHTIAMTLCTAAGTSYTSLVGTMLGTGVWMMRPVPKPVRHRTR